MTLIALSKLQHQTLQILVQDSHEGQPINGTNLAKRIGLKQQTGKDGANLRSIIHTLRIKGFPICANGRGYFYARSSDQLSKFITKMQGRVLSQEQALKGLKESFHNIGYQILGTKVQIDGSVKPDGFEYRVRKAVRGPTGGAMMVDLKLGADGRPIVPEGMQLI